MIAIIVPAYNEALRFKPKQFLSYIESRSHLVFIFVDDGSTDNTFDILKSLEKQNKYQIHTIKLSKNSGKAEAIRQGINYAHTHLYTDYIGFIDGDLEIPLEQIDKLEKALKNSDKKVAFSNRILEAKKRPNIVRSAFSGGFKFLTERLFSYSVNDSQCGCKLFDSNLIPGLFSDKFISKWLFDVEILLRIQKKYDVSELLVEVPLNRLNEVGTSRIRAMDIFKITKEFLFIYFHYK